MGRRMPLHHRTVAAPSPGFSGRVTGDWKQRGGLLGESISGGVISNDFLPVLRAHPLLGRLSAPQEGQPGPDLIMLYTT